MKYSYLHLKTRKQLIEMNIEQKKIIKYLEDRCIELKASNKYKVKSFADFIREGVCEIVKRDKQSLINEAERIVKESE